jgi:hypothetical protein
MTGNEFRHRRWVVFFGALVFSAIVGVLAYNAGMSHGLVQGTAAEGGGAAYPYPSWTWYSFHNDHFELAALLKHRHGHAERLPFEQQIDLTERQLQIAQTEVGQKRWESRTSRA